MDAKHSTPTGRICTKCREFKSLDAFSKAARGKFGRNSRCRDCAAEYQRANKDRVNALSLARYHRLQGPKRQAKKRKIDAALSSPSKRCSSCRIVKPKSDFGPDKIRPDGLRPYCRECKAKESREFRKRNPEAAAKASRDWAARNPDRVASTRRRFQQGSSYRAMHAISTRIYRLLKGNKNSSTEELVGYSKEELKDHLERQFLPGMSWDNYGDWHIDHIRPLKYFEEINEITIRQAWCLTNLRPLWARDNLRKNAKITHLI